jgi:hypothetical protein
MNCSEVSLLLSCSICAACFSMENLLQHLTSNIKFHVKACGFKLKKSGWVGVSDILVGVKLV